MPSVAVKDTKRLFLAVELPDPIKKLISSQEKELMKTGSDTKWVSHENLHITLKFLGTVPFEKIDALKKILNKNLSSQRKLKASLAQIGAFPSIDSPRIIWVGFNVEDNLLTKLAEKLEDKLYILGFEKEVKKFQAHATIGRIRSRQNEISLIEKIRMINSDCKTTDFKIDNITLFESKLNPQGSEYSVIHQVKFLN